MGSVRTLLITGGSGAGRTAVACATAAASAGAGGRTLLLTADTEAVVRLLPPYGPTGSDALGSTVPGLPRPYPVDGTTGFYVAPINPSAAFRTGALDFQDRIGSLLALLGAPPLDPEELTDLPGADALALLRALRETGVTGGGTSWDLVVVDLPPVRDAVALLALPEQLRRYLRRLLPADRQAARALRPVLAQLAGVPMPAEWAYESASRADRELEAVQTVIEDPGTAVAVVVEPGPAAEALLRTARTGLALYGRRLAAVVVNRLLPTGSADPFLAALSGEQQDRLKALAGQCAADGVPLRELPHLGGEPRDAQDLSALALPPAWLEHRSPQAGVTSSTVRETVHEAAAGRAPEAAADPWTVVDRLGTDGYFVWSLPLPGAARDGLDLIRRGDELVVDAGGFRRIMPLPSALRRCTVAGAALRDGALHVRFTPDPELWPR